MPSAVRRSFPNRLLHSARWLATAAPAAIALSYLPTSALPQAHACVPPTANSGWSALSFAQREGEVATDGFIVVSGVADLPSDELARSIQVKVVGDEGIEVAGSISVLSAHPDKEGRRLLAWSASETLPVEAKLTATLSTERASVGTLPSQLRQVLALVVVGEPTALSAGAPRFGDWGTFSRGVGEPIACMPGASGCGPGLPPYDLPSPLGHGYNMVPAGELRQRSAMTYWEVPEIRGNVAWEATAVLVGDASGGILPDERPRVFATVGTAADPPTTGLMIFPDEPQDYCIALRVRDLRTGEEVQSEVVCAEPGASKFTTADTGLRHCALPPNDALAKTWCEMHPGSTLLRCRAPDLGGGGTGNTADMPAGGGTPDAGGTPSNDDQPATRGVIENDKGCAVSRHGRGAGTASLGLLGLGLLLRWLRHRRERGLGAG